MVAVLSFSLRSWMDDGLVNGETVDNNAYIVLHSAHALCDHQHNLRIYMNHICTVKMTFISNKIRLNWIFIGTKRIEFRYVCNEQQTNKQTTTKYEDEAKFSLLHLSFICKSFMLLLQ